MLRDIEERLDAIRSLCREYGVRRLDLFGSATGDRFMPDRSDVDLLVEYDPATDLGPWLARQAEFRRRLSELLGREVDLVMTGGLRNPYFIASVDASRRTLYVA